MRAYTRKISQQSSNRSSWLRLHLRAEQFDNALWDRWWSDKVIRQKIQIVYLDTGQEGGGTNAKGQTKRLRYLLSWWAAPAFFFRSLVAIWLLFDQLEEFFFRFPLFQHDDSSADDQKIWLLVLPFHVLP